MKTKILITEQALIDAGFEFLEHESELMSICKGDKYASDKFKIYRKWTGDKSPIKLDIDNGLNNSGRMWHLHIDNSDCNTIGCADIDYTEQFNKLMEIFNSNFRI